MLLVGVIYELTDGDDWHGEPWGGALKLSTVRMARAWLANPDGGGPALARDMQAIVDAWPGGVCADLAFLTLIPVCAHLRFRPVDSPGDLATDLR